jgi:hypothetical protein
MAPIVPDSTPRGRTTGTRPVTTLWTMASNGVRLSCAVYRAATGLELRVESETATMVREPFELQPRAIARTQALRESLRRRGWQDCDNDAP